MSVRSDSDTPVSVCYAWRGSSVGATGRGRLRLVGQRFGVNVGVARADHRPRDDPAGPRSAGAGGLGGGLPCFAPAGTRRVARRFAQAIRGGQTATVISRV